MVSSLEKTPANQEDQEAGAKQVVFRYRPALIEAASQHLASQEVRDPDLSAEDAQFFEKFMSEIDLLGIENYSFYTPENFPKVKIPFTRIKIADLYERLGGKLSNGFSSLPKEKTVFYPAWVRGVEDGHPGEMWGEIYRQAALALNRLAVGIANDPDSERKSLVDSEIIAMGSAHGFTGKTSQRWLHALRKDGFKHYQQQYAKHLQSQVLTDLTYDNKLTLMGYSAGTQTAYSVAKHLKQLDISELTVEAELFNPAGFHEQKPLQQLSAAIKLPAGFFGTAGWLQLRNFLGKDPLFAKEREADEPFRQQLIKNLGSRYQEDSNKQRELKLMTALAEGLALIKGNPYIKNETDYVTEIRGALDPVSFDKYSVKSAGKPVNNFTSTENRPQQLLMGGGGHYIDYNELRVNRFLHLMHSVHTRLD
jgi:hypothetical protein